MSIEITQAEKRSIERIMSSADWLTIENFRLRFEEDRLEGGSIKRATEFDTIWYAAHHEGSKNAIRDFFLWLEKQAIDAQEK